MKNNRIVKVYEDAFNRIVSNCPLVVPVNSEITLDNVAREAGRKKGSLRARPGYESLIEKIKAAHQPRAKSEAPDQKPDEGDRLKVKIDELMNENEILRSKYLNLLHLNAQLFSKLHSSDIDSLESDIRVVDADQSQLGVHDEHKCTQAIS